MNDPRRDDPHHRALSPMAGELVADYRERLARHQFEAEERRARELAEQSSTLNSAADRIRIWERRHGLPLPTSPSHRLLAVVAAGTGLSLEAVRDEQRLRRAPRDGAAVARPPGAPLEAGSDTSPTRPG
ncbi:MAG: hypothetical protein MUF07_18060 [Steroidobacteraceae bacterium]|jgi:hypothetical protein|nr:hypothetical protein [Steroidobacteraceae bacterium]